MQLQTGLGPSIILHKPTPTEDPYPTEYPTEEQFVLRLDPELATRVKNQTQQDGYPKDLQIEFTSPRLANLKFQELTREAVLVDLPCIIESQKTIDKKQFYKISDICQMLVVTQSSFDHPSSPSVPDQQRDRLFPVNIENVKMQSFRWPHGLTPPLYDVRSRRFRKKPKGLTGEDIENVLQRLIQADNEAIEVEYSVQEDLTVGQGEDDILNLVANIEENLMDEQDETETLEQDLMQFDNQSEFGVSLAENEMMKNLELLDDQDNEMTDYDLERSLIFGTDDMKNTGDFSANSEIPLIESQLDELASEFQLSSKAELQNEIAQLQSKIDEKLHQLEFAPPNPLIKQRLTAAIHQLQEELEQKQAQL